MTIHKWILCRMLSIMAGAGLDLLMGDPLWLPHPVRWMGRLIGFLEKLLLREGDGPAAAGIRGGFLTVCVFTAVTWISRSLLLGAYRLSIPAGICLESVFCFYALAARSLADASMAVCRPLIVEEGDFLSDQSLEKARLAVSMIVGRDTERLDRDGILRAAVETVSENTMDGVIGPLFYMLLFGGTGAMAYKAVNTMDSMIGYQNDRYRYFGTAAAKLDDAAGFLPARLSGVLLVAAAKLTGLDAAGAWRIFLRDRYNHKSPNSAQSESACAGALGLQLGGDAFYSGRLVKKPFIGDPVRKIEPEDIPRVNRLMYVSSGICLILVLFLLGGLALLTR